MSKHDYSQGMVTAISEAILNSKNNISNTVLSIESMPYSWDTGIIHNVVTWFEVLSILGQKEQMENSLEKAEKKLRTINMIINQIDLNKSQKLSETLEKLKKIKAKANEIQDRSLNFEKIQNVNVDDSYKTQNVDQTIKQSNANNKLPNSINQILNKWYNIDYGNGQNIKVNVSQIILSYVYYVCSITKTDTFSNIIGAVQEGKMKINNGRIEIGFFGGFNASIETENSINIKNDINELKEALTTCSFGEIAKKGTYSVEKDGTLKYSYSKQINKSTSLDISVSFNPNTRESKVVCKIKYTDPDGKTNHSLSLNLEKINGTDLTPVSEYEFSNASEIYANMNCWQKAMKWTDDIMTELKYQTNKTTDQISDSIISAMEKTYNFMRKKILGFPDLLANLNRAIDAKDVTMICFAIMAILVAAAEIGGCLVLA